MRSKVSNRFHKNSLQSEDKRFSFCNFFRKRRERAAERDKTEIVLGVLILILICAIAIHSIRCHAMKRLLSDPELTLSAVLFLILVLCVMAALRIRIRKEQQKKVEDIYRSRIALISSQVQPHFLYNAISAIRMIDGNPQETIDALGDFAKFLRASFSTLDMEHPIPFEKELELVQEYVRLEKLRFQERLEVRFDLRDKDFVLPAMALEVLVENAVKHGIAGKKEGGTVCVSSEFDGREHILTVRDDGVGFDVSSLDDQTGMQHYGLRSVKNRLQYQTGGRLEITSVPDPGQGGTTAVIRIPEEYPDTFRGPAGSLKNALRKK